MSKFKVGDRVRVVSDDCHVEKGSIHYIDCIDSDGDIWTNANPQNCISPESLELANEKETFDPVQKPSHYNSHPSGIQCIDITKHMGFNLGNVIKYVWRADLKDNAIEDLKKAKWYIENEIEKRENDK